MNPMASLTSPTAGSQTTASSDQANHRYRCNKPAAPKELLAMVPNIEVEETDRTKPIRSPAWGILGKNVTLTKKHLGIYKQ
jgi:hypothetical protein